VSPYFHCFTGRDLYARQVRTYARILVTHTGVTASVAFAPAQRTARILVRALARICRSGRDGRAPPVKPRTRRRQVAPRVIRVQEAASGEESKFLRFSMIANKPFEQVRRPRATRPAFTGENRLESWLT
jgi:hypothetical protein